MRHCTRHLDQALYTTQTLRQREDLGRLAEPLRRLVPALDAEGQHASAHAVTVLLQRDGALRMRVQAGVVHADNVGAGFESGSDACCVLASFAGAQVQCLQPAVGQPAVECGGHGADGVLQERKTVVEFGGVEGCGAHDDVGVPVDVLCDGVHDDVGAVVERVLHVRRHEGVVDYDHDAVLVRDGSDLADVDKGECWVGGRLDPDEFRVWADQLSDVDFDRRAEGDFDIVRECDLGEVAVRAAVDVRDGDDVRACGEGLQDVGGGRGAGTESECIPGVLEGCDCAFEVVAGKAC